MTDELPCHLSTGTSTPSWAPSEVPLIVLLPLPLCFSVPLWWTQIAGSNWRVASSHSPPPVPILWLLTLPIRLLWALGRQGDEGGLWTHHWEMASWVVPQRLVSFQPPLTHGFSLCIWPALNLSLPISPPTRLLLSSLPSPLPIGWFLTKEQPNLAEGWSHPSCQLQGQSKALSAACSSFNLASVLRTYHVLGTKGSACALSLHPPTTHHGRYYHYPHFLQDSWPLPLSPIYQTGDARPKFC